MSKQGVFGLKSADDLFVKLEADYERVKGSPHDAFCAYDFVVTAWHLLEWWELDEDKRETLRNACPLLQLCEHLAVGAKHFTKLRKKHRSVQGSSIKGPFAPGVFAKGAWKPGVWDERVVIELTPEAAAAIGKPTIEITELADKMMDYWTSKGFTRRSSTC